jgi:hypothetical protein
MAVKLNDEMARAFVDEMLTEWGEHLMKTFKDELDKKGLVRSGHLRSKFFAYIERGKASNYDSRLKIGFPYYGRIIDSLYYIRKRANRVAWGVDKKKKPRLKDTRWYSINLYSNIPMLVDKLRSEYSEYAAKSIVDDISGRTNHFRTY